MWEAVLPSMVRVLVNDSSYDESKLISSVIIAGFFVIQDHSLDHEYTFDYIENTITPDPVEVNDQAAIALLTLKAACIITMGDYQDNVRGGIKMKEGDSSVDTTGSFQGYKDIIENGPCDAYNKLLKKLHMKQGIGRAVLGPFVGPKSNIPGLVMPFFDSFGRW